MFSDGLQACAVMGVPLYGSGDAFGVAGGSGGGAGVAGGGAISTAAGVTLATVITAVGAGAAGSLDVCVCAHAPAARTETRPRKRSRSILIFTSREYNGCSIHVSRERPSCRFVERRDLLALLARAQR